MKHQRTPLNIRGRLIILVALGSLFSVGIVGFVSYFAAAKQLNASFVQQALNINQLARHSLSSTLQSYRRELHQLANNPDLARSVLHADHNSMKIFLESIYNNSEGQYENVFITTAEANPRIIADGKGGSTVGVVYRKGYESAIDAALAGKIATSDPQISPVTKTTVIYLNAPIMEDGKVIGLLATPIFFDPIIKPLTGNSKIGQEGYAFVARISDGMMGGNPDKGREWTVSLHSLVSKEKLLNLKENSITSYSHAGQEKQMSILKFEDLGIYIISTISSNDVNKMLKTMRNNIIFFGFGVSLLILIGLTLTITMSLKPLKILTDTIVDVENNVNFSQKISVKTMDEVGQAAIAFNSLADSLRKAIGDVISVMQDISQGDLSQTLPTDGKGEIHKLNLAINESVDLLGQTLRQMSNGSTQITTGAEQLATSSQSLASGASEQASDLEETSAALAEIEMQTDSNKNNALQAQTLSNQALKVIDKSTNQMNDMLLSMSEINNTSSDIAKIIKVIDEIAFQTNLLALNAAVEAARAGKYGKGFAVVAEEVRNLASRSADAARNTTDLIENSTKLIENGVLNADKTAEMLSEIKASVSKIDVSIAEITAASLEQAKGIVEINQSMNQVNQVVQENSSISEETAAASEELNAQALDMQELVSRFKLKSTAANPETKLNNSYLSTGSEAGEIIFDQGKNGKRVRLPSANMVTAAQNKKAALGSSEFGKY
ncbi:HAMP domain-containing protein [bacterium]|nr:HAMP domain-containing protein [bacterium]